MTRHDANRKARESRPFRVPHRLLFHSASMRFSLFSSQLPQFKLERAYVACTLHYKWCYFQYRGWSWLTRVTYIRHTVLGEVDTCNELDFSGTYLCSGSISIRDQSHMWTLPFWLYPLACIACGSFSQSSGPTWRPTCPPGNRQRIYAASAMCGS